MCAPDAAIQAAGYCGLRAYCAESLTESVHAFRPPLPFPTAVHGIGYEVRGRLDSVLFGTVRFSDNGRLTLPR